MLKNNYEIAAQTDLFDNLLIFVCSSGLTLIYLAIQKITMH